MSEVVGFELKPQPDTSLSQMIEHGLSKHLDRYVLCRMFYWKTLSRQLLVIIVIIITEIFRVAYSQSKYSR